jgi:hypothetical protein
VLTGGGSTRGGESTPLLEEQYREKQKEEKQKREELPGLTSDFSVAEDFSQSETTQKEPDQPTPELSALLPKIPQSSSQTENPAFGSKVLGSFDKHEQTNIVQFSSVAVSSSRDAAKLEKYQQLDAEGVTLKKPELVDWASLEIGQYVLTYRKSGCILTGGNDVSSEFAVYVAKQNCRKGQEPTIALGFNVINKCETDPRHWQKLVAWVVEWQQQVTQVKR